MPWKSHTLVKSPFPFIYAFHSCNNLLLINLLYFHMYHIWSSWPHWVVEEQVWFPPIYAWGACCTGHLRVLPQVLHLGTNTDETQIQDSSLSEPTFSIISYHDNLWLTYQECLLLTVMIVKKSFIYEIFTECLPYYGQCNQHWRLEVNKIWFLSLRKT